MKIHITKKVAEWYKEELQLQTGDFIRFFPRYGGVGGNIPGFSIGINSNKPIDIETTETINGISFYIEKQDLWYFNGRDLKISFDEQLNEPKFSYI